jgi:hypothetical protein
MLARSIDVSGAGTASFPLTIRALTVPPTEGSDLIAIPPVGDFGLFMLG